jgi:hypothetical protein
MSMLEILSSLWCRQWSFLRGGGEGDPECTNAGGEWTSRTRSALSLRMGMGETLCRAAMSMALRLRLALGCSKGSARVSSSEME